ncbi:hypothetical protein [Tichowtungia aerotolerans]|uniref:Uncharacterized protein n=1 Tax=Tichowtungia aerotolerans TaxID=2697043 RepID=A0A6P1M8C6_9BACT|nr:hypothetical protein [Tichowtungia aerotolerans]QHI68774.1 hypothetical protein GT409_04690 [Tichowtungia aerotolerans]
MSDTPQFLTWVLSAWDFLSKNAIALCALFVAIQQGIATRRHNRLSVLPALDIHTEENSRNNQIELIVRLRNAGLGPAIISSYEVLRDGEVCDYNNELIRELLKTHGKVNSCKTSTFGSGKVVQVGEEHIVCQVVVSPVDGGQEKSSLMNQIKAALDESLNLVVNYKSFYGQRMPTLDTRKQDGKGIT